MMDTSLLLQYRKVGERPCICTFTRAAGRTASQLLETCLKGRFIFLEVPHEVKEIIMNNPDEMVISTLGHLLYARPCAEHSPGIFSHQVSALKDSPFPVLVQEMLDELG